MKTRWIDVKRRLPRIPRGKYGVPVLVAAADDDGWSVYEANYASIRNSKGEVLPMCSHCTVDFHFLSLYYGSDGAQYGPCHDVRYWMPMPKPPRRKVKEG